jgi:hypothetical protein
MKREALLKRLNTRLDVATASHEPEKVLRAKTLLRGLNALPQWVDNLVVDCDEEGNEFFVVLVRSGKDLIALAYSTSGEAM